MEKTIPEDSLTIRHIRKLTFSGLKVSDAMRRKVVNVGGNCTIEESIRQFFKYKVAAMLVTDPSFSPLGVLSKTEIMGAYYAQLPKDTLVQDIMSSPALCCRADDSLEDALTIMQGKSIHRLYVLDGGKTVGTLAYPDIIGLLYRYCHRCEYGLQAAKEGEEENEERPKLVINDVITPSVRSLLKETPLFSVIEELAMTKLGALLMCDEKGEAAGVISKTDLALAYKRGISCDRPAEEIMSKKVHSCRADEKLENGLRTMIIYDLSRLFVFNEDPKKITGVLSLSDAARSRSGSCQACASSRIFPQS